jgi:hypothetical protein
MAITTSDTPEDKDDRNKQAAKEAACLFDAHLGIVRES